jgi:hypothetical protein
MTQKEKTDRQNRARALVDLVSKTEGGYRVQSSRDSNTSYFVSKPNGRVVCTCSDFEKHPDDPRFVCKHILAVREAHRLGKVNGNGTNKAQIDLEVQAMFGDPEAARQLNAQVQGKAETPAEATPSVGIPAEIPEPEEEIPTGEEAVQLEPCLVCHTKALADEMILVSVPSGTGLVCRTCYDGRKACGSCGARLPLEELTLFEAEFGPVTLCRRCALSREWDEKEKAKSPASTTPTLADHIVRANKVLASFGNAAIEKVAVKNRQGQVVKELFGYGLQYTLDAVNAAIGPDAWRYKILEWRAVEGGKGALVLVELEIWDGARWHSHGPMFGTTGLADEGDGLKGAIGDALKKSLAYWGIGNLAYRGELRMAKA